MGVVLLEDVKPSELELKEKFEKIKGALGTSSSGLIENLANGLAKFIGYESPGSSDTIGSGGIAVTKGYKKAYDGEWNNVFNGNSVVSTGGTAPPEYGAKIFLGCVPMIFSALSYLYWRCDSKGNGEWIGFSLKGSGLESDLKDYMVASGFKASELNGKKYGSEIAGTPFSKFKDFSDGMTNAAASAKERADKEDKAKKSIYPGNPLQADKTPTYPEFLKPLLDNGQDKANNTRASSDENSFSILFHIAKLYFRGRHIMSSKLPDFKARIPSTIREMLYFLAALPFSPSYDALDSYISNHFKNISPVSATNSDAEIMIPVADSNIHFSYNALSAANLKDYLTTSCSLSLTVLGIIQGSGASEKPGEPWLHELFSNSAFHLNCPAAGPTLFRSLSSYTYALQFQLYFLYAQCAGTFSRGFGWRGCKYGSTVNSENVTSHICSAGCTEKSSHNSGDHTSGSRRCKHSDCSNNSPLQAFLTDKLKGFSLSPSSTSGHLSDHPPGFMCHFKMGFTPQSLRPEAGTGNYIYSAINHFCSGPVTPLRQLCEKLGCLAKRAPRTLGDVFGFIWQLNSQLFNKTQTLEKLKEATTPNHYSVEDFIAKLTPLLKPVLSPRNPEDSGLIKSLKTMAPLIPFLYQLFKVNTDDFLPVTLFNLAQHCHKVDRQSGNSFRLMHKASSNSVVTPSHDCTHSPNDLWSLYQPVGPKTSQYGDTDPYKDCRDSNCGGYLEPLTLNYGATFSPSSAPVYLSWMAYLTDDLYEQLSDMLHDFNNISCDNCNGSCTRGKSCHSTSGQICQCVSVVQCAGVLPVLYKYGFQFHDTTSLSGWKYENRRWSPDTPTVRSCENFHSALSNVLSRNAPLAKLLESIDSFLYMFRFYFFYNLSSFWLCSLVILLYFIFYGIDVLHVRSHLKLTLSHRIPPIGLLTTGKAPALTKLTYYMP
ncbi:extracellular matrix-binding protein ebh [Babesia caballi]|uniref:Extracellular matrix-binding protein ebh n=1 Tax=Babesia caballi TaxID=5871 RepID=A0AAV4LT00_BABCB|nr:extracellular matrix-binding protein ebh [Babesia caballi]